MTMRIDLLYWGVAALGFYQLYVTIRVAVADQYSFAQKFLQVALIWLLPVMGALVCHIFLVSDTRPSRAKDSAFIADGGGNPPGASDGSHH